LPVEGAAGVAGFKGVVCGNSFRPPRKQDPAAWVHRHREGVERVLAHQAVVARRLAEEDAAGQSPLARWVWALAAP
jgi:hypothetical protein